MFEKDKDEAKAHIAKRIVERINESADHPLKGRFSDDGEFKKVEQCCCKSLCMMSMLLGLGRNPGRRRPEEVRHGAYGRIQEEIRWRQQVDRVPRIAHMSARWIHLDSR